MNTRYGTRSWRVWSIASLICGALSLAACLGGSDDEAPPVQPATFRSLGVLPGYVSSQANAVSSNGAVVVGTATTAAGKNQAFRWNVASGMVGLGFMPGGTSSAANAVSADGTVVVVVGDAPLGNAPTPSAPARWTAAAGMQPVDPLPGSYLCSAGGISGDGMAVVGTCLQINNMAFRWASSTGSVALGQFGGGSNQQSSAAAISLDGTVVVGAGHPSLTGAVKWALDGSPTVLGKLPGDSEGAATAVSRDGLVVVGWSTDSARSDRAFRWTQQAGMVTPGHSISGLLGSVATSVSGDGRIVVGAGHTSTAEVALIWDMDHGMRLLEAALLDDYQTEIPGWKLTRATAISDDGLTIAGHGTNPQGQTEAWIVKLPQ
jgi:probable HAF family extracellular repeat protein